MADENKDLPSNKPGEESAGKEEQGVKEPPAASQADQPAKPDERSTPPAAESGEKAATPPGAPAAEGASPPKAPAAHKPEGAKPPPVKKGPTVTVEITDDPLINRIKERFGESILEAVATLGQQIVKVKKERYSELCRWLHDDEETPFDLCSDLTAVHWPDRKGEEFEIVLQLYSVPKNRRLRVKTSTADGEGCPTVTDIWSGANWMEREAYDMFGVKFEGHPDLRRILMPEDWPGFPLRKEYPIEYRDNEWTDKHLEYREIDYDTSLIDVKYGERR